MSTQTIRAAVVGAVESSAVAARHIAKSNIELVGIAGYEPANPGLSSDVYDLRELAEELGVDFYGYTRVNDQPVVDRLQAWDADFLFIVGLSQLVSSEVRSTARRGCIGYHPTALPKGRGRAPVAWITLGAVDAASTLFEIGDDADNGGILEQVPFDVTDEMDADAVTTECLRTLAQGMDQLLPKLERLEWAPAPQDESLATYLGKRDPGDGLIDWHLPAKDVDALIRAAAPPHPGAYVYSKGQRLQVHRSGGVVEDPKAKGIVGKVLRKVDEHYEVQCGDGVVRISEVYDELGEPVQLRDGVLLETRVEDELHALKQRVEELEALVSKLTAAADTGVRQRQ
jgi:methionyl-tRNA formyltransferase